MYNFKKRALKCIYFKKRALKFINFTKKSTEMCQLLVKKIVFKLSPFEKKITS